MIVCPKCGSSTGIRATRASSNYIRRRRQCDNIDCRGRVTTIETIVSKEQHHGDVVVISLADLRMIAGLASDAEKRLLALTEPRVSFDHIEESDDG